MKKRILFVITSLGGGGAERVLVNLVNNLNKEKYDISVKTIFDIGINRKYLDKRVHYLPGLKYQFPGNVLLMRLFSSRFLYRLFIKEHYDIIVSYLEGPTARIVSGCPFEDTKTVCWIHREQGSVNAVSRSFRTYNEAKRCYSKFNSVVFVSKTVERDLRQFLDFPGKTFVLYNTIEDKLIINKSHEEASDFVKPDVLSIFSIGRLCYDKGYDMLINVHKRLIDEGLLHKVFILGDGPLRTELENRIHRLGLEESFVLLGFKENPYKYLQQADLFVCSSRREGISTAVAESLILGIPVVSTRCSGAEELLGSNNEYGLVTDISEQSIYEAIKNMINDKEKLYNYKNRSIVRGSYFSKESTVKAVENMFDGLYE